MDPEDKIKILESLLEDIKQINPEYIIEYIEEQIDILKYGI
jgi:hypothetical protein